MSLKFMSLEFISLKKVGQIDNQFDRLFFMSIVINNSKHIN